MKSPLRAAAPVVILAALLLGWTSRADGRNLPKFVAGGVDVTARKPETTGPAAAAAAVAQHQTRVPSRDKRLDHLFRSKCDAASAAAAAARGNEIPVPVTEIAQRKEVLSELGRVVDVPLRQSARNDAVRGGCPAGTVRTWRGRCAERRTLPDD